MSGSEMDDEVPSAGQFAVAIEIYLAEAYERDLPPRAAELLPPPGFSPREYLMSDRVERTPPDAPFAEVRSFALRLGNRHYTNMKLRLSRPPHHRQTVLSVDCHDAFLHAPPGSPDHEALAELKRWNAEIASAISEAWDAAGLPTEKNFLRGRIEQVRRRNAAAEGDEQ